MQFAVRTLAPDMSIASVVVEAPDEADARRQVEARGLYVSAVEAAGGAGLGRQRGGKLSLVLFSQELLALLNAGLGIVEGLEALLEKEHNPAARNVLERLLAGLREGKRLSGVLAAQPGLFPPLYVGIVRAAEGTSDLPRALARYIDYQQRIDTVRAKIVSASIYPVILLAVGGGVSVFLIAYVVPRFAEVYQGAGRNLPWMSQLMLDWGQFAARHGAALAAGALCAAAAATLGVRRVLRRAGLARLLARVPGVGERVRIFELSRLYLTLGMLSEGGITILNAIDTVQSMVSASVRTSLAAARAAIESGQPLSDAFEANGLTTPISLRMLRVGERTGEMGPMLTQSAAFYDGEISRWIDRFTRTFEPLLMAAIGLVVGAIVVLLYMPIFDLAGDMS
jgi:general secretion pathway protein F